MTALATLNPIPQYFDLDGSPLDAGYLFFGIANQNPETAAITVYWDAAATQPATQPIRTLNGYPARNGTPAIVYTTSDYSLMVRNKRGRQVLYAPNSADFGNAGSVLGQLMAFIASLASSIGASLVGFLQSGAGAVLRTAQDKLRERITPFDFMTAAQIADVQAGTKLLDVTAPMQAFLTAAAGREGVVLDGGYKITSMLTMAAAGSSLTLSKNAEIDYSAVASFIALKITATDCVVRGGKFTGPASWDGTNVAPTYGVIWIAADRCTVESVRLVNVRKVGLWFKDVVDGTADRCVIEANYPQAQWTGVETVNYGIQFDPSAGASGGNFKAQGNTIKQAVQGIFAGNYGIGGIIRGLNITSNLVEGCWNHGVYTSSATGAVIDGNTFNRCQLPVASTGSYNSISDNTIYTTVDAAGDERDVVGISVRDSVGTVVSGNTIKGVVVPAAAVVIDVRNLDGVTLIERNVIANNVIEITAGTVNAAIRIEGSAVRANRNDVHDNVVTGIGNTNNGLIVVGGAVGSYGNNVHDNSVRLLGGTFGLSCNNQVGSKFHHNTVEIGYDAGAAANAYVMALSGSALCLVESNQAFCESTFGQNITLYGYREFGACSVNRVRNNIDSTNKTKLAGYINVLSINGALTELDDRGPGVPTMAARTGSTWNRVDGGAASSFFVKESGTDGTGWVAK